MKKIIFLILITIIISGCSKEEFTSKSCNMKENNIRTTFNLTATNKKINKVVMKIEMDNSLLKVESLEILDDKQKTEIKENVLKSLGLDRDEYEGINIEVVINKTIIITINADLNKADKEILKKIGMDFTDADLSLKRTVKSLEEKGAICN